VLLEAGKDLLFTANSIRSVAASRAVAQGVPIDWILAAGDWATESTFTRFIRPPATTNLLILQVVLSKISHPRIFEIIVRVEWSCFYYKLSISRGIALPIPLSNTIKE
jgi:hypothetical protein